MPNDISAENLRAVLDYNKETGAFVWKSKAVAHCYAGKTAGTYGKKGYRVIKLNQKRYPAHRLAWLYVYGEWPTMEIDHINRIKDDNRICNLRDVSSSENKHNCVDALKNNTTGFRGVKHKGSHYEAWIKSGGVQRYLGTFKTPEDASAAYIKAKKALHPCATI